LPARSAPLAQDEQLHAVAEQGEQVQFFDWVDTVHLESWMEAE